jgi:hypothetical protein
MRRTSNKHRLEPSEAEGVFWPSEERWEPPGVPRWADQADQAWICVPLWNRSTKSGSIDERWSRQLIGSGGGGASAA